MTTPSKEGNNPNPENSEESESDPDIDEVLLAEFEDNEPKKTKGFEITFFVFKCASCLLLKSGQPIFIWCKILMVTYRLIYLCLHDDES